MRTLLLGPWAQLHWPNPLLPAESREARVAPSHPPTRVPNVLCAACLAFLLLAQGPPGVVCPAPDRQYAGAAAPAWAGGGQAESLAPLQPYCLRFTPSINGLLGMHIFCDCETMAEAGERRLVMEQN